MADEYSEKNTSDIFADPESLDSVWARLRVKQEYDRLGWGVQDHFLVVEDCRRLRLPTRVPGMRWKVTPVRSEGIVTEKLIEPNSEDASWLPKIDRETLTPEGILAIERVMRRGGRIIQSAQVAEILNNPPDIEIPDPTARVRREIRESARKLLFRTNG